MSTSIDRMDAKRSFGEQSRLFDRGNPRRSSEFGERQKIIHGFAVEGIGECHATIIFSIDGEQIKWGALQGADLLCSEVERV